MNQPHHWGRDHSLRRVSVLTRRIALLAAGASAAVAGLVAHALPGRSSPAPAGSAEVSGGQAGQSSSSSQLQAPAQAPAASSGPAATVTGPTQG